MLAQRQELVYFCDMEKRVKVIYDDHCPTCRIGISLADSLDRTGTLEFIGMNTEEGAELVREHSLDMSASAYILDGSKIEGKAAFMRTLFRRGGFLGFLISLPFRIPYVGTTLYSLLARHRAHVTTSKI